MESALSVARAPRLSFAVDGALVPGVVTIDVSSSNYFTADRFSVSVALAADPYGLRALAGQDEILAEIAVSLGGAEGVMPLITGEVDGIELDPIGGILRLEGRDL